MGVVLGKIAARRFQFVIREKGNAVHSVAQVLPELLDVPCFGKTACHSDNGDAVSIRFGAAHTIASRLCLLPTKTLFCRLALSRAFWNDAFSLFSSFRNFASALMVGC